MFRESYLSAKIQCILQPEPTVLSRLASYRAQLLIFLLFFVLPRISSSLCRTISTDITDPFSPPLPIVHCFRQIFRATSRIGIELLYVSSCWSSYLCPSMWRGPHEYIPYAFGREYSQRIYSKSRLERNKEKKKSFFTYVCQCMWWCTCM